MAIGTAVLTLVGGQIVGLALPVQAATTYTVTTTDDNGDGTCDSTCTLRDAVDTVNAGSGGDTITVPAGTYRLTQGVLDLSEDVTIDGQQSPAESTIVDGVGARRVFHVETGVTATIQDMKIRGGHEIDDEVGGGGILNAGDLTLTRDVVAGNEAADAAGGGGIYSDGTLTLDATTVRNNISGGPGGGISNQGGTLKVLDGSAITTNMVEVDSGSGGGIDNAGDTTISNSSVSQNDGGADGGGVYGETGSSLTVDSGSHIDGNTSYETGGGIALSDGDTTATLTDSSVNDNVSVNGDGGGINSNAAPDDTCSADDTSGCGLQLLDTTVDHNAAHGGNGGGISNSGTVAIAGGSIDGNSTSSNGGGIFSSADQTILTDTEVNKNAANDGAGGGIYSDGNLLSLSDTNVDGNMAYESDSEGGGGIDSHDTTFSMTSGSVSGNSTTGGAGGGLYLDNFSDESPAALLKDVTVAHNSSAATGGGIYNDGDDLTVTGDMTGAAIKGNSTVDDAGGGLDNAGTVLIDRVIISQNVANGGDSDGGGIVNESGATLTVTHSAIDGNATSGNGGGIANLGALDLSTSSLTDNLADNFGGGLFTDGSDTLLTNDTLSGNVSAPSGGGSGGGIYNGIDDALTLTNVTISDNQAIIGADSTTNGQGGGLFDEGDGSVTATNTIIARNMGGNCNTQLPTDLGSNLSDDGSCFDRTPADSDKVVPDPGLAPLAVNTDADPNNITSTQGLRPTSPALNAGDDARCPDFDQRGQPRSHDPETDSCDIGAFEGTVAAEPRLAGAFTYTVNTTADHDDGSCDSEDCSLRDAIRAANSTGGTIGVQAGIYKLTLGELTINHSMTISGVGSGETIIDGQQAGRVFYVGSPVAISVGISSLTVRNGDAVAADGVVANNNDGGGVYLATNDTVTLSGVVVAANVAGTAADCGEGAGIYNSGGTLLVQNQTAVRLNTTCGDGGGIYNGESGSASVTGGSAVTTNFAGDGAGIYDDTPADSPASDVTVTASSVTANLASGDGGGLYVGVGSTAAIESNGETGSDVSGNAANDGGGIYNDGGDVMVSDSSVSNNAGSGLGGGIDNEGSLTLQNTSLDGNTAAEVDGEGGGLYNDGSATITDGEINGNVAYDDGGGVYNTAPLNVSGTSFQNNVGDDDGGGAIYTDASGAVQTFVAAPAGCAVDVCLSGVDISGNTGYGPGGGLRVADGVVNVENSTISFNHASSAEGDARGGGIYDDSTVTLTNVDVHGNDASDGGAGIYNEDELDVTGGSIRDNIATADPGGGLWNDGGTANLTDVAVDGNAASGDGNPGGGIYNDTGGTLTVDDSSLSGNRATDDGGGLATVASATVTKSEISRNTALGDGGGASDAGTLTLLNSTVSGNRTDAEGGGVYAGVSAVADLANDTITDNGAAVDEGGGLFTDGAPTSIGNTIVADNTAENCQVPELNDRGHNLEAPASGGAEPVTTCGLTDETDVLAADAGLNPLALNAPGDTRTHALKAGSPAVDAGDDSICSASTSDDGASGVDQRGVSRQQGSHCDIGAFEFVPTPPGGGGSPSPTVDLELVKTATPTTVAPGGSIVYHLAVTNDGPDVSSGFTVTDTLPAAVSFTSASSGCTQQSGKVTCTSTAALAKNATKQYDVTVTAPATEQTVNNTASVKGVENDPNATNDQSSAAVIVQKSSPGTSCATHLSLHRILVHKHKTRHDGVHRLFRLSGQLTARDCVTSGETIRLYRSAHRHRKGTLVGKETTGKRGKYSFVVFSKHRGYYYHAVFRLRAQLLGSKSKYRHIRKK